LPPLEAIQKLVHFTIDFHNEHGDDVRLVITENMQRGRYIKTLPSLEPINSVVIDAVRRICDRGAAAGEMRDGIDADGSLHVDRGAQLLQHLQPHTFSIIFNRDMESPAALEARKASITDMILRYVTR
jgi:hypothetical protein